MLQAVLEGKLPPWLHRLVKQVGRSINRFGMIAEDDSVLIGSSGGKDSLVLALVLALRKRWLPIDYTLKALHIDWYEYPMTEGERNSLIDYFGLLKIPLKIVQTPMKNESFNDSFNCYICARNRRRILFEEADRLGIRKIALGHHLDDIVETILINLCFRGSFETMKPLQNFFGGKLQILRPLCELPEHAVVRIAERLELPVVEKRCPYETTNIRHRLKPLVTQLSHIDRNARVHMFEAVLNNKTETCLPEEGNGDTLQSGRLP